MPDSIPVIGYSDDTAVVASCSRLVGSIVEECNKYLEEELEKESRTDTADDDLLIVVYMVE